MRNQGCWLLNMMQVILECWKRGFSWKRHRRKLLLTSLILVLNLLSGGILTIQAEEACLAWDITGRWSYNASHGGYGIFNFQQNLSNGWLTGSWENHATSGSGTFDSGGIVGMQVGFHATPNEDFNGIVSADGTTMRGTYLVRDRQENGSWEMSGQARCTVRQAPLPAGSGRATMRWGDYVFRVALDQTSTVATKILGNRINSVTYVTGVPTIPNPFATTIDIEAVYRGNQLPSRLRVINRRRDGIVEYIGWIYLDGYTPAGEGIYRGSVTVPKRSIGPGESVRNDIYIENPVNQQEDYVIYVLQTIVDPSGYIFDAATSQTLEGAIVSCYQRQGDVWVLWNADEWKQINPQVSDNVGHYGWDVPAGDYRVEVSRDCYQDGQSPVVTVPPPRTDVHIGLKKTGCSSLDINDIWTTDKGGLSKSVFKRGDPIIYHVEVNNSHTCDISSTIHWTVTDPKGQQVAALSGSGIYSIASFGAGISIKQKLPLNLAPGDYRFRVHQTYLQQTSSMVTQFSIPGSLAAGVPGMLHLLLGN